MSRAVLRGHAAAIYTIRSVMVSSRKEAEQAPHALGQKEFADARRCASPEAIQRPERVNVTCVTPLGEDVASTT